MRSKFRYKLFEGDRIFVKYLGNCLNLIVKENFSHPSEVLCCELLNQYSPINVEGIEYYDGDKIECR